MPAFFSKSFDFDGGNEVGPAVVVFGLRAVLFVRPTRPCSVGWVDERAFPFGSGEMFSSFAWYILAEEWCQNNGCACSTAST